MEKYKILEEIGRGRSGVIHRAFNNETSEIVAVKKIYLTNLDEGVPSSVIREISFLKEMEHSNIVRLLDVWFSKMTINLVLEFMKQDLKKFLDANPMCLACPGVTKNLMRQLLSALRYCHSQKVFHRNLKPQSLLIDPRNLTLKLADFGSAQEFRVPTETLTGGEKVGTPLYEAPELLVGDTKYSASVDIWSAGCIFAEMVTGQSLFMYSGGFHIGLALGIVSILGGTSEESWPGVSQLCPALAHSPERHSTLAALVPGLEPTGFDLLSKMLVLNPKGRITAAEALRHPYLEGVGSS